MEPLLWAVAAIAAASAAALLVRHFLAFTVRVCHRSMLPGLRPRQTVLAVRVHNPGGIERGDIIIFRSRELGDVLIKRVIGLPGDTVRIDTDGSVFINGERLAEPYAADIGGPSADCLVPAEEYFVLGDNRGESADSRHWENPCIRAESIMGKAVLRRT